MSWNEIGKIVLELIAGIGGVGAVFIAVIRFSSNIIAERLTSKYELKLNKELEKYKANLESDNHISRALFDKEFNIYQKYSNIFGELHNNIQIYHHLEYLDRETEEKEDRDFNMPNLLEEVPDRKQYKQALSTDILEELFEFRKKLSQTDAFIPNKIWNLYMNLYNVCLHYMKTNSEQDFEAIELETKKMQDVMRRYLTELIIIE